MTLPNPSASDLLIAIKLLADTKSAVQNIQVLEAELKKLGVTSNYAKSQLSSVGKISPVQNSATQSVEKLNTALTNTEKATKTAGKGLFSLTNFARTDIGTLEAMAIFLIGKFVSDALTSAINGVKQLELAFYNLAVAEKTLSNAGIDITPKDLRDIIQAVKDLNLAISDTDINKSVAELATGLQDLGLSPEQLKGLSKAAAIISVAEGLSMENVVDQFAQGIAKGGRGLADLDIQVDAAVIKQKALEEGLVANEEAWNNLTAAQKQSIETQALYLIIMDSANTKMEELGLLQDSVTLSTREASAEWENLTTTLGTVLKPVIIQATSSLIWLLEVLQKAVSGWGILFATWVSGMVAASAVIDGVLSGNIRSIEDATKTIITYQQAAFNMMMMEMFPNGVPGINGSPTKPLPPDTPTSKNTQPADSLEQDQEDLQKALEKMNNEIIEAQLKLAQDMEDAQIDLGRKLVDITSEYARKRADAEREYSSKVADINSDYRNKIAEIASQQAEANQKARNDELEREAKFQEEMQQLKEKFLMELEDALHARDARQVLRLIKQYNLDKTQAEREHALDQENAKREQEERNARFARERADAERDRKAKLANAQRDYQDKLAKLAADEAAERAAAELAYQRKMQDLEREMKNRLEIVAANLVAEFNLTKSGLDAIVALYQKYYAEVSGIYAAMNAMLAGAANLSGGMATNKPNSSLSSKSSAIGGGKRYAEGGSMIANKPTTVTFGDNNGELELATFTPLQHTGRDMNKLFSNLDASQGGMSGALEIGVALSPDLEARIMKNTLGQTANIITKVSRSK